MSLGSCLWACGKRRIETATLPENNLEIASALPLGVGSVQGPEMVPISLERLVALRGNGEEHRAIYRGQTQQLGAQQMFPVKSE